MCYGDYPNVYSKVYIWCVMSDYPTVYSKVYIWCVMEIIQMFIGRYIFGVLCRLSKCLQEGIYLVCYVDYPNVYRKVYIWCVM